MSRCPWTRPLSLFASYIKDSCCFPLSVHASLCQPVVHDAEGADPSRESVLPRAGAGLARVPDGHLRKLLLHNRQVHLQDRRYIKRNNRWGNICSLRLKSYPFNQSCETSAWWREHIWLHRCDTRRADGVFSSRQERRFKRTKTTEQMWLKETRHLVSSPHTHTHTKPSFLKFLLRKGKDNLWRHYTTGV